EGCEATTEERIGPVSGLFLDRAGAVEQDQERIGAVVASGQGQVAGQADVTPGDVDPHRGRVESRRRPAEERCRPAVEVVAAVEVVELEDLGIVKTECGRRLAARCLGVVAAAVGGARSAEILACRTYPRQGPAAEPTGAAQGGVDLARADTTVDEGQSRDAGEGTCAGNA